MREHEERRDGIVLGSSDEEVPVEVGENEDGGKLERGGGSSHPSERHEILDETLRTVDLVILERVLALLAGSGGGRGHGILGSRSISGSDAVCHGGIGGLVLRIGVLWNLCDGFGEGGSTFATGGRTCWRWCRRHFRRPDVDRFRVDEGRRKGRSKTKVLAKAFATRSDDPLGKELRNDVVVCCVLV